MLCGDGRAQLGTAAACVYCDDECGPGRSGLCQCQLVTTCALQKADVKGAGAAESPPTPWDHPGQQSERQDAGCRAHRSDRGPGPRPASREDPPAPAAVQFCPLQKMPRPASPGSPAGRSQEEGAGLSGDSGGRRQRPEGTQRFPLAPASSSAVTPGRKVKLRG